MQVGNPGNVGGTGRPPNEIRRRMRQHLDEELIQACLDDWQNKKCTALQVAEFFAKHALPTQSESLSESEGRAMIQQALGSIVDSALAYGVSRETVQSWYAKATEGL